MLRSSISCFISSSTMSSSRFNARGRNPWHRGFCSRPPWDGRGGGHPFVSGDSHLNAVRDANYEYRQGHRGGYPNPRGNLGQYYSPPHPHPQFHPHPHPHQQFRPYSQPQYRPQFRLHPPRDDHRKWIYAASQPPPQCERFTVVSYNILADYLVRDHRSKLYFHIPHHILDWEWRKNRLFLEFGLWAPDIMCLQEVDRYRDLEEELSVRGYAGIWQMRTGNAVDGCAIFWRTNRFHLRHEEHIEFNRLGLRDNVAQICVLESRVPNPAENQSKSLPRSSDQSRGVNQVIICNIHVLYNPKRGEMKLGQVRLLLDRAYAVSRIWNDAPIIVCGDFNCTPKSPLYNFISEQKLSLSGLARDQISGQYAASIYAPRPYVGSGSYRPQHSLDNSTKAKDVEQADNFKGIGNHHNPQNDIDNSSRNMKPPYILTGKPSGNLSSCSQIIMGDDKLSSVEKSDVSQRKDEICEMHSENPFNMENFSNQNVTSAGSINNEPSTEEFQLENGGNSSTIQTVDSVESRSLSSECVPDNLINRGVDSSSYNKLCDEVKDLLLEDDSRTLVLPAPHEGLTSCDFLGHQKNATQDSTVEDNTSDLSLDKTLFEDLADSKPMNDICTHDEKVGADTSWNNTCTNQLNASTCNDFVKESDKTMVKDLHPDGDCGNPDSAKMLPCPEEIDSVDTLGCNRSIVTDSKECSQICEKYGPASGSYREQLEDHSSFGQGGDLINEQCSSEENSDPNFLKELIGTEDSNDHMENNFSFSSGHKTGNMGDIEKHYYNPYLWTPEELEVASGSTESSVVEHTLKLRSAYTDVEDYAGTKGPSREPEVTSYNRLFMGTVDYVWYSDGLQTVRVLDTIPKHILQRTPGFPTRRWGSDHIALACEFAFTKYIDTTK